jgi:hypothetical protein
MRNLILLTLISLIVVSCKDKRFDDIDFLTYSYRQFDTESPDYQKEWKIICPFYLHIDNAYNCQMIRGKIFSDSNIYYIETKKDPKLREIIDEILNKSINYNTETDFRSPLPVLYDGSDLKIRITKNGKSKIIHFWQDNEASRTFEKLHFYSISLFENGSYTPIDPKTEKRKQEFVKFVIKSDSILRLLPPNPPIGFKPEYIPPKAIE